MRPNNRGFENTWAAMKPRDREAYDKIAAAATPKARREMDRDFRKMGQLHGVDRRLNEEGELDDEGPIQAPTRPIPKQGGVSLVGDYGAGASSPFDSAVLNSAVTKLPGMAQGFGGRSPWAPGAQMNPQAINTLKNAGLGWNGPVGNTANTPGRPTFGGQPGFRDNMYLVGRDGPALPGMGIQDKIPALPKRSQTLSPGIGLDGKRINYGRR